LSLRGRPPISEAEKDAKGTKRAGRDRGDAPEVEAAILPPPEHLTERAAREWKRLMPMLTRAGLFTALDSSALEAYCVAYDLSVEAQEAFALKPKLVIELPNGFSQANPLLAIISGQQKAAADFGARFGLDPASRSKLRVQKPKAPEERNKIDALRKAGRKG
jgi:P27 family predicted phage terminase small subunit